jgi:hypothetical protein
MLAMFVGQIDAEAQPCNDIERAGHGISQAAKTATRIFKRREISVPANGSGSPPEQQGFKK